MSDQLVISGALSAKAQWDGQAWSSIGERWPAPDLSTAQRWVDELRARGGIADVSVQYSSIAATYFVNVAINPYGTSSSEA